MPSEDLENALRDTLNNARECHRIAHEEHTNLIGCGRWDDPDKVTALQHTLERRNFAYKHLENSVGAFTALMLSYQKRRLQ